MCVLLHLKSDAIMDQISSQYYTAINNTETGDEKFMCWMTSGTIY